MSIEQLANQFSSELNSSRLPSSSILNLLVNAILEEIKGLNGTSGNSNLTSADIENAIESANNLANVASNLGNILGAVDGIEGYTDNVEALLNGISTLIDGIEPILGSPLDAIASSNQSGTLAARLRGLQQTTENSAILKTTIYYANTSATNYEIGDEIERIDLIKSSAPSSLISTLHYNRRSKTYINEPISAHLSSDLENIFITEALTISPHSSNTIIFDASGGTIGNTLNIPFIGGKKANYCEITASAGTYEGFLIAASTAYNNRAIPIRSPMATRKTIAISPGITYQCDLSQIESPIAFRNFNTNSGSLNFKFKLLNKIPEFPNLQPVWSISQNNVSSAGAILQPPTSSNSRELYISVVGATTNVEFSFMVRPSASFGYVEFATIVVPLGQNKVCVPIEQNINLRFQIVPKSGSFTTYSYMLIANSVDENE